MCLGGEFLRVQPVKLSMYMYMTGLSSAGPRWGPDACCPLRILMRGE